METSSVAMYPKNRGASVCELSSMLEISTAATIKGKFIAQIKKNF
jgi:hypothetical protein